MDERFKLQPERVSSTTKGELPEFTTLLAALEEEAQKGTSLAKTLTHICNVIKPMTSTPSNTKDVVDKNQSTCLLDSFWDQVNTIRGNNDRLHECAIHLNAMLGD